jgi:SAM-dependent methyltransferase
MGDDTDVQSTTEIGDEDVQWHKYVCGAVSDSDRLHLQHNIFLPHFEQIIGRVLDEYGLAARLSQNTATTKGRVLDIGCGEGLFLHDTARLIEARGFSSQQVSFYGLDISSQAIATAEEFSRTATPPRPYLNFYVFDASQPLEECLGLQLDIGGSNHYQFDFIYASLVLAYLPHAQQVLSRYFAALKPGGVLYLREVVITSFTTKEPHPVFAPFSQALVRYIANINKGVDVATNEAAWLRELGAVRVEQQFDHQVVGGSTPQGIEMLRNRIMIMRNSAPRLISVGLVTQQQYDEAMATIFREVGPHLVGQLDYVDTLAQKPL